MVGSMISKEARLMVHWIEFRRCGGSELLALAFLTSSKQRRGEVDDAIAIGEQVDV
jgi:hypothetical protein